ncbi:DUF2971 domain-containing protein [Photobacterium alginatilyticum]|uniref:DUF2971 domain-containing protein n=1 Tax=Photobacterium alginatilyticum TaxID=1775171 RepID=A0ABW9YLL2_9GAMM|nr:DUF2971 domain-containing protein [Photobacterium alginatilyticum]NBI54688.1 DUF2971 domain-containing protein [Photobacterium alginatilyticum]
MLKSLYKYASPHPQIFDNLLIRASQRYSLNDPFELRPSSENVLESLSNVEVNIGNGYKPSYDDYGIISFTETYNNLLMWAHYANEHKGIVIEFDHSKLNFSRYQSYPIFDNNEDDEMFASENPIIKELNEGVVQRILYNHNRPNERKYENILEHFLVKSDEWMYEKEHRVIVPLITAECIIIRKAYLEVIDSVLELDYNYVTHDFGNGMVMVSFDDALRTEAAKYYYASDCLVSDEEFFQSFKLAFLGEILSTLSKDPSSIFLYKLPSDSIKRVFFGCRMSEIDKKVIMRNIERNESLWEVSFTDVTTSPSRFELNFSQKNG